MRTVLALALSLTAVYVPAEAQSRKTLPPDTAAAGDTRTVTLVNKSRRPIEQVFISPSTESGWGEDLLGSDVIDTNKQMVVNYRGPCRADVQVAFEGGAMEARRRIDVCATSRLTIEPGWTLAPNLGGAR